jgi:hypothetical protein
VSHPSGPNDGPHPAHDPYEGLPPQSQWDPQQSRPAAPQRSAPKKSRKWLVALIVVGLVAILFIGGCFAFLASLGDDSPEETEPVATSAPASPKTKATTSPKDGAKPYTLKVTKCARGEFGFDVGVKIKNNTEETQTFFFDIVLRDEDDNTVGSGYGSVEDVRPGKEGTAGVLASLNDSSFRGKVTCDVKVNDF